MEDLRSDPVQGMIEDDGDARPLEKEQRRSPRRRKAGLDLDRGVVRRREERERDTHSKASLENNHGPIFLAIVYFTISGPVFGC